MESCEVESDDEIFNTEIIDELEDEVNKYQMFFYSQIEKINVYFIYINRLNEIHTFNKINYNLENNVLTKDELLFLIKRHSKFNNKKYRLWSLLSYQFDLENDEIQKYYKNIENYQLLQLHTNLNPIVWNKSINFFKELNDLYFLFVERKDEKKNKTRRIFIKNKKLKKTKRKRLK